MKRFPTGLAIVAALAVASPVAYGQNPQGQAAPSQAKQPTDTTTQRAPGGSRQFINDLSIAGMAEVQLGQLAKDRSSNPDVQAFGEMMVSDHTQLGNELQPIAFDLNAQMPPQFDQAYQELANRLNKLQGAEFDREYIDAMVKAHQQMLAKLKARVGNRVTTSTPPAGDPPAAPSAPSPEASANRTPRGTPEAVGTSGAGRAEQALTDWAANAMARVEQHLERALEIQKELAK